MSFANIRDDILKMQIWVMYFSRLAKIFTLRIVLTLDKKKKKGIVLFYLIQGGYWFLANKRQEIWMFGPWMIFGKVVN